MKYVDGRQRRVEVDVGLYPTEDGDEFIERALSDRR